MMPNFPPLGPHDAVRIASSNGGSLTVNLYRWTVGKRITAAIALAEKRRWMKRVPRTPDDEAEFAVTFAGRGAVRYLDPKRFKPTYTTPKASRK